MKEPTTTAATRGHSTTLVGVPAGLIGSAAFNDYPVPLHISGTREANRGLFDLLEHTSTATTAAQRFHDYMALLFALDPTRVGADDGERRRYRSSYLRLLKGWGFDANGREGAVLKGWVESRFGLFPTFHKSRIERFSSPAWTCYVEEKMSSRFHNNSINMQLDLLYEFAQWSLARFHSVGRRHVTLYRGTNDFTEHPLVRPIDKRQAVIRLNNLVSFTSNRELASEFGDYILEARVPTVKILFFNDLLPLHPLKGEAEYLVIGGDFQIRVAYV